MPAKVVVRDLHKRYGGVQAARGVTFDIDEGEIFGLLGPNGAGKTTTLECVIGLREPDAGHITICGLDARRQPREVKRKIGAALQTTALQDKITPREALALFGSFYQASTAPQQLLDRFALAEKADAAFDTLSDGQKQRLALALAFVNDPELVFLDEPTAGLDPQSRHELHDEITGMRRDGRTVLLTTHYIDEANQLCDRVGIIDRGSLVAIGTPADLIAGSSALQSVTLVATGPLDPAAIAAIDGAREVAVDGIRARFRTANAARTVADLMAFLHGRNIEVAELHVQKATLEEVFLDLTSRRQPPQDALR